MPTTSGVSNAPIVELVIGLHFNGIEFSYQDIYDFYQSIKSSYPIIQEHPPLPFLSDKPIPSEGNKVPPLFGSRKFFMNQQENRLIQIQPDKILINWRKTTDLEQYPHFHNVYDEFINIIEKLKPVEELRKNVIQLEVTYLDHIIVNQFGKSDFNPNDILTFLQLTRPVSSLRTSLVFPIPELDGYLSVDLKSAVHNKNQQKLLVLESNCRGPLGEKTIKDWFTCAHKNINDLFLSITTDSARLKWGI